MSSAQAFRPGWEPGDEIVVTNQDHEANIGAWRRLVDTGITVKQWLADPETGLLELESLRALVTDRTRLIACTHCSNIIANPNPIPDIAELAHAHGASLVVDGVSYAPHGPPDVPALGADVYLFSLYKVYGPHQGAMVVRKATMEKLANQSHYFNDAFGSKRLVPAGPDHAQVAATNGVVDYFDALHDHHFGMSGTPAERGARIHDLMRAAKRERLEPLLEYLKDRSGVRVLGPTDTERRVPTVALATDKPPEALAAALAEDRIMAGSSHFYAPRILEADGRRFGTRRFAFVVRALHECRRRCGADSGPRSRTLRRTHAGFDAAFVSGEGAFQP